MAKSSKTGAVRKAAVTAADARRTAKPASKIPGSKQGAGKPASVRPAAAKVAAPACEQPAREVFETLGRWHQELASAAQALTATGTKSAGTGAVQFAALLNRQKDMAEQVKASLSQFQNLIDTCERQLEAQAEAARHHQDGDGTPIGLEMPVQALQSFQQMALSNIGLWTKAAQDYQGLWLDAMQAWMPMPGMPGADDEATASGRKARRAD
jgi:hypothetical protein